jgi:hypothetical protein
MFGFAVSRLAGNSRKRFMASLLIANSDFQAKNPTKIEQHGDFHRADVIFLYPFTFYLIQLIASIVPCREKQTMLYG